PRASCAASRTRRRSPPRSSATRLPSFSDVARDHTMNRAQARGGGPIGQVEASAYRIPTDAPESDGTYAWDATTLIVARASAGGKTGLGYTYADAAAAALVRDLLANVVAGIDAFAIPAAWTTMTKAIRNNGRPGIASLAISAVDAALWDLKGQIL